MLLLLVSFIALMFIGLPIGFCLFVSSIWYMAINGIPLMIAAQRVAAGADSFPLLALSFFILAGSLMNSAGITAKIFDFTDKLVGHFHGGLGHANVLASVIFSGMSGSAVADTGGLGAIELKAMKDAGYDEDFALAVTGASSIIGPIVPPSVPAVVLGVAANISIGRLFMGGVVPGLLMAGTLCVMIVYFSKKRGYPKGDHFSPWAAVLALKNGFFPLLTPVILIGGIISGIFTPTEAAIVAVVYALLLGIVYHALTMKNLPSIFIDAIGTTVNVLFIIASSTLFAWLLTTAQVPQQLSQAFLDMVSNKYVALLIINVILLFAGCFLDTAAAIVIFIPIFMPIILSYHIDPVHFGIMMILNLMLGLMTPPVGMVLFVLSSVSKVSFEQIAKAIWPFVLALFAVLVLIIFVPEIVTFLPNMIFGS